ncbi:MAG TPA: formylmethanofuran dehydrogenase [Halobacteria archaeon]|jgi:formylmethanofuran dehydrogenase subunit D|nr:formylmethanofuran dehydrogenase [Halobacteria archaeon]
MRSLNVVLLTGSTIRQGMVIKGGGKLTKEYRIEAAYCLLNSNDYARLGKPEKVKVKTEYGTVTVFAKEDAGMFEGEIFIPRGPWANILVSPKTMGTGSPMYKGMKATVEPSNEDVLESRELFIGLVKKVG